MSSVWGPLEIPPTVFTLATTGRDHLRWLKAGGVGHAPAPCALLVARGDDVIVVGAHDPRFAPDWHKPVVSVHERLRPVIALELGLEGGLLRVSARILVPDEETDWRPYLADLVARSLLAFPVTEPAPVSLLAPPPRPDRPAQGLDAPLDEWFRWYHAMRGAGFKCTLGDVARGAGLSLGYIKQQHAAWLQEHGPLDPE